VFGPVNEQSKVLRERSVNTLSATPQKRSRMADKLEVLEPTVQEVEQTPAAIRFGLGPTPQKDGEVLGIFDMLPGGTPSKGNDVLGAHAVNIVGATPSKPTAPASSEPILSRTPQSSSKRYFLGAFAGTPMKRQRTDSVYTPSTPKRQYATPSFLRRDIPLAPIEEDDDATTLAPPFKKRNLVRSLSTIIQGLKKQEEQRMDDDWDILDEIEAEERGEAPKPKEAEVLVEDSQAVEMPLGPDQGVESSEDEGAGDRGRLDANGNPRKVWKKKGLKRQTRRVVMRPVVHKSVKAVPAEEEGAGDGEGGVVGERQLGGQNEAGEPLDDSDDETSVKTAKKKKAKLEQANAAIEAGKKTSKAKPDKHANFRRLNIKSKNAKPKGRGGGRFGRR